MNTLISKGKAKDISDSDYSFLYFPSLRICDENFSHRLYLVYHFQKNETVNETFVTSNRSSDRQNFF